jgi:predicted regulator of Ras-like GTPase activity (Roadblock/LC7/MglB family)
MVGLMAYPGESRMEGFEGSFAGLELADLIQLNGNNRFSGCVSVRYDQQDGQLFFSEGEIIHAEQGSLTGESAFYQVMRWPGGQFGLQPNVATTRNTIHRSWKFLLMEAHRLIDEERSGRIPTPPVSPPPPPQEAEPQKPLSAAQVIETLRQIPGVDYAVLLSKEGAAIADDSFNAETLAGQAAYIGFVGRKLGALFGAGDLSSASVQGVARDVLLLVAKNHQLCVLIEGGSQPGAVEAQVRKIVMAPR